MHKKMSSERLNMIVVIAVMTMAILQMQISDAQTSHTVGDSIGWTTPPDPNTFANWAASHKFAAGDTLVFNFQTGAHTVAEVTKDAYNACNAANPISEWDDGPASVTLSSGPHFYLCTIPGHCDLGQKFAITV